MAKKRKRSARAQAAPPPAPLAEAAHNSRQPAVWTLRRVGKGLAYAAGGALGGLLCFALTAVLILSQPGGDALQLRKEEWPMGVLLLVGLLAVAASLGVGYLLLGEVGLLVGPVVVGAVAGGVVGFALRAVYESV